MPSLPKLYRTPYAYCLSNCRQQCSNASHKIRVFKLSKLVVVRFKSNYFQFLSNQPFSGITLGCARSSNRRPLAISEAGFFTDQMPCLLSKQEIQSTDTNQVKSYLLPIRLNREGMLQHVCWFNNASSLNSITTTVQYKTR